MRSILVHPPLCDPSCPPLGLAYLSATLEKVGVEHKIFDLNLDFIDYIEKLASKSPNTVPEARKVDTVNNALPIRSYRFPANPEAYLATSELLKKSFYTVSGLFPKTPLEPYQLIMNNYEGDLAEIIKLACDPKGLYMSWLQGTDDLASILTYEPAWIGISVSYMSQLPAALAIAHQCKKKAQTTVILGGGLFKDFETCLGPETPVWDMVDGIVVGAGEEVLRSLVMMKDGTVVPSVGRRDFLNGKWIASSGKNSLAPQPNFSHFPLHRYRSAGLVLPYRVFSRCSWDKCVFCADSKYAAHEPSVGGQPQAVAEELTALLTKYVADGIYFLDAELPKTFMNSLSKILAQTLQNPPRWGANARFSSGMADPRMAEELFRGGCRFLRFGMESASPRILSLMRKSIDPKIAEKVLASIHSAGIATHVYLMKGFPGETPEDWSTTADFIIRNSKNIDMFSVSAFQLYSGSPLSVTLKNDVCCHPTPDRWVYPRLEKQTTMGDCSEELETAFFACKESTRCFLSPADTIILADKMSLSYHSKN